MSKTILLTREDVDSYLEKLVLSAANTQRCINELIRTNDSLGFLSSLKFKTSGCDPLNASRPLNLIEQLNQTFTYLASFKGANFLFERHPEVRHFTLNLGTAAGSDIESQEAGGIAAEVFAAVSPQSNSKLKRDIDKVTNKDIEAQHRYVLFMSPGIKEGVYSRRTESNVLVWSLGMPK